MIRVAVWVDYDTEFVCAYILLPGCELEAAASNFQSLALAIEDQVVSYLPSFVSLEIGYRHFGCLKQPVNRQWLRQRLEQAV
jgi:hypothetical protein